MAGTRPFCEPFSDAFVFVRHHDGDFRLSGGSVNPFLERLHHFHGQRRSGVAAGDAGVVAGRIVATGFHASPDVDHGIGYEHRGFDHQLPIPGNAVINYFNNATAASGLQA